MTFTMFWNHRIFRDYIFVIIAECIAHVVELEMRKLCTEAQVAFMRFAVHIAVVAFQLYTVVLLLTVDVSEESGIIENVIKGININP